ncbi:MAG: Gfo/Idh/MocA family oxidoreductase [Helicobacteraceae bacterium]
MSKNFALIGVGGYIAPRHLRAIKDTGNNLIAALDKNDSVGVMDAYFPQASFFTEFERFDRFVDKWHRSTSEKIDFVSITTPNYLHDAHIRFALRNGADAICEKPLVLNPHNIDQLKVIEQETGKKVFNILQLRLHPSIIALKKKVDEILAANPSKIFNIKLDYITSRGKWYFVSWKGDEQKSGGIATNIGVHFFDMLVWVFGAVSEITLNVKNEAKTGGGLRLKNANVEWFLSVDAGDLPQQVAQSGKRTFRSIRVDNEEIEFSDGFTDLHTASYQEILAGRGFGLDEAYNSINIVSQIRKMSAKN